MKFSFGRIFRVQEYSAVNMSKPRFMRLSLIILSFICVLLSGCDETRIDSDWREHQIVIDGKFDDWASAQTYYDEKEKVVVNLANDNDYFYICLVTRNRGLEVRLMESGFMAWFDPAAGRKKVFGIRFPIGLRKMGMSLEEEKRDSTKDWYDQEDQSGVIDREKERWQSKEFNKQLETVEGLQDNLEIVNAASLAGRSGPHDDKDKNKPQELNPQESVKFGIEAKVGRDKDYFVYELKIPLKKSVEHPYAIDASPGKSFGLGLEIAKFGFGMRKGPKPDDAASGGDQAPSEMGRHSARSDEVFQLWAIVTLASDPAISN
ncbi:MAG: hypothetical protein NTY47_01670 [Candidatus Omnitrophica bacterium]|nr:hypothetical protein [Candidatus Omnitrophota bacterium]